MHQKVRKLEQLAFLFFLHHTAVEHINLGDALRRLKIWLLLCGQQRQEKRKGRKRRRIARYEIITLNYPQCPMHQSPSRQHRGLQGLSRLIWQRMGPSTMRNLHQSDISHSNSYWITTHLHIEGFSTLFLFEKNHV